MEKKLKYKILFQINESVKSYLARDYNEALTLAKDLALTTSINDVSIIGLFEDDIIFERKVKRDGQIYE